MVRAISAAFLLAASAAHAVPAVPSFEVSAAQLQSSIGAMHSARLKSVGGQIDSLAWDLERGRRDAERLRSDLRFLLQRVRAPQPGNGRPGGDPSLRWDVQRFTQELSQLARDSQWRLDSLRMLTAQAVKDESLVPSAQRLQSAARWQKSETNWLAFDARFAYFDFIRAGYSFEAMDLDRDSRDADARAQDLQDGSDRLLAKVRGS